MVPSRRQIRDDVEVALAPTTIRDACVAVGHRGRDRQLDPVPAVHLLTLQFLHRNTACAHSPDWSSGGESTGCGWWTGPGCRIEPRSRKRRAKKYPYTTRPRNELWKQLIEQQLAA